MSAEDLLARPEVAAYEADFHAWTRAQAAALRAARPNAVDWRNLAEEIEAMGVSQRHELRSRLAILLEHLLKLSHSPARAPRIGWRRTLDVQRDEIATLIGSSPSLRGGLAETAADAFPRARRAALLAFEEHEPERLAAYAAALPEACPWSVEELIDVGFVPGEPS